MASLKFIMDVDVDPTDTSTPGNKRPPASFAAASGSRVPTSSAHQGHAPTPGPDNKTNPSPSLATTTIPPTTTEATTAPGNVTTSTAGTTLVSVDRRAGSTERAPRSPGPTSSSPRPAALRRRQSTTSTDSMDQHGFGAGGSGGGRGGPGRAGGMGGMGVATSSNHPARPMAPHTPTEATVRLTPITGRISRARKGQPVHTCETCTPPKTFTRAEHLRRHQLSHQTPRFQCTFPGCDRAFHRPDLLARHQQKHDQEGDRSSSTRGGGSQGRRGSSASMAGSKLSLQPSGPLSAGPLSVVSGSSSGGAGAGESTPTSSCDLPPNSNAPNAMLQSSVGSNSGDLRQSRVPPLNMPRRSITYDPAAVSRHQDYSNYVLSPSAATNRTTLQFAAASNLESPSLTTPTTPFHQINYQHQQPRSQHEGLYVVTEGLPGQPHPSLHIPDHGLPELIPAADVSLPSPWESSTDSTYSTPASDSRSHRHSAWAIPRHSSPRNDWLSPYPPSSAHETMSMESIAAPYLISQFPQSPHHLVSPHTVYSAHPANQGHPFGILDVSMAAFSAEDPSHALQQVMAADPGSATLHHSSVGQRGSISLSSVRSPSPVTTSGRLAESLVAPSMAHSADRVGMLATLGRQKEVMVADASSLGMAAGMADGGASLLGAAAYGFGGGGDSSPRGGGFMAAQGLGGLGGCASAPILVKKTLPRPSPNKIPAYLETYWSRFHAVYPVVHRQMSDETREDALLCAMAAVGTQLLKDTEHHDKGVDLHDFASQELGLATTQSNLQIMQAIVLCEYFSLFRGKKLRLRLSNRFKFLYSRRMEELQSLFDCAPTAQTSPHLTTEQRWRAWINLEARRRLLNSCYYLEIHTSIYRYDPAGTERLYLSEPGQVPHIPLVGRSSALWAAQSAEEWDALLNADPGAGTPVFIPHPDSLTPMIHERDPRGCEGLLRVVNLMDLLVILAFEASRLPKRSVAGSATSKSSDTESRDHRAEVDSQTYGDWNVLGGPQAYPAQVSGAISTSSEAEERILRLFPGCPVAFTYLAIHHTPLKELLSVCGDSWMFSKKVLSHETFKEYQRVVSLWTEQSQPSSAVPASDSLYKSVVRATQYAARALVAFLGVPANLEVGYQGVPGVTVCALSDYWAMFVCALICWASTRDNTGGGGGGGGGGSHDSTSGLLCSSPSSTSALSLSPTSSSRHAGKHSRIGGMAAAGATGEGDAKVVADGEALVWLRSVASTHPDDAAAWVRLRVCREAGGVVGLVRRRLEEDLVRGCSRLYDDAVSVLEKLEEGVKWN